MGARTALIRSSLAASGLGSVVALLLTAAPPASAVAPQGAVASTPPPLPRAEPWVEPAERPRATTPGDRYDLASGCYAMRTGGTPVGRAGSGFGTGAAAEPFHLRATTLGRYLLFATRGDFLAGTSTGAVTAAASPSDLAEFEIEGPPDGFTLTLPADGRRLVARDDGRLEVARGSGSPLTFTRTEGCATWPDVGINITGEHPVGRSPYGEVEGYLDAHVHMMAFEFLGGKAHCAKPWDRFGVTVALVDCPDHGPGGYGAALETVLSNGAPGHDTVGWPTFVDWPAPRSLTHEQMYYRWLERSWRGGQRLMVNLLVDNGALCELYPLKQNSCDEMDAVRLQAKRIRELEAYIDAQHGGPGEGWFRIVTDPYTARRVINAGRLAVVLGIETSEVFGCTQVRDVPQCTSAEIEAQLDEVHALGVRQMELVNKFDNALAGVAGDSGSTGMVVNTGNFYRTGSFWAMQDCPPEHGEHVHDKEQLTLEGQVEQDAIFGAVLQQTPLRGTAPVYGDAPHCNARGLTPLGKVAIDGMMRRRMIFDPDHMSVLARTQSMDLLEAARYPGVISSHGWSTPDVLPRIYALGGVITPYAGSSVDFVRAWRAHRAVADRVSGYDFAFGFGADTNGFGAQGSPRGASAENPVRYPFTGLGGVTVHRQVSGERTYDVNVDGVAHYGLYPDWIEDLRRLAGQQIVDDLAGGAEAYLQMWERTLGVAADRCRQPSEAPGLDVIRSGMTPEAVLGAFGQPTRRTGTTFEYCVPGGGAVSVEFGSDERVRRVVATAAAAPVADRPAGTLPATGGAGPAPFLLLGLVAAALLLRRPRAI